MPASITVKANYKSGWFVIAIPTLIFLVVWIGLPLLFLNLSGYENTAIAVASFTISLILALVIAVITYKPLLRLTKNMTADITIDDRAIRVRHKKGVEIVHFNENYNAYIAAGESGVGTPSAGLNISSESDRDGFYIHISDISRDGVLKIFKDGNFVTELAISCCEGMPGYELDGGDDTVLLFLEKTLDILWRTRNNNRVYRVHEKFPWDYTPKPEFSFIKKVDWQRRTPEDEKLLMMIRENIISNPIPHVSLGRDYMVYFKSLADEFAPEFPDSKRGTAFIIPIGSVTFKKLVGKPDWGDSFTDYLKVSGSNENNKEMKLEIFWDLFYKDKIDEANILIRYVNSRHRNA